MSEEAPAARRPWWRLSVRDVVIVVLLALLAAWLHWPREAPGPVQLVRQGTVGGTSWSVLAEHTSSEACLQVRAGGARRALMCDQHWDRPVHRLWHGPLPASAGSTIGPPSLLRVSFPDTDQVLVVSVLYGEIATLSAAGSALPTTPLFDTDLSYVVGVVPNNTAPALQAFAPNGEPLFYYYADTPG